MFVLCLLFSSYAAFGHQAQSNYAKHPMRMPYKHKFPAPATIYFVEIPGDTYAPVLPNTIKRDANKVISLDADNLSIFYHIISRAPGRRILDSAIFYRIISGKEKIDTFDSTHTRLRLDVGKEPPLFIDQQGIVLCNHMEYRLTPLAFVELDHFIANSANE